MLPYGSSSAVATSLYGATGIVGSHKSTLQFTFVRARRTYRYEYILRTSLVYSIHPWAGLTHLFSTRPPPGYMIDYVMIAYPSATRISSLRTAGTLTRITAHAAERFIMRAAKGKASGSSASASKPPP